MPWKSNLVLQKTSSGKPKATNIYKEEWWTHPKGCSGGTLGSIINKEAKEKSKTDQENYLQI